jgi:hypothetical protein
VLVDVGVEWSPFFPTVDILHLMDQVEFDTVVVDYWSNPGMIVGVFEPFVPGTFDVVLNNRNPVVVVVVVVAVSLQFHYYVQ